MNKKYISFNKDQSKYLISLLEFIGRSPATLIEFDELSSEYSISLDTDEEEA